MAHIASPGAARRLTAGQVEARRQGTQVCHRTVEWDTPGAVDR